MIGRELYILAGGSDRLNPQPKAVIRAAVSVASDHCLRFLEQTPRNSAPHLHHYSVGAAFN